MVDKMSRLITTHTSVEEYFSALITDAIEAQNLQISDDSSAYLLQLMKDFGRSEALVGPRPDEPGTPALFRLYERAATMAPSGRFDAYRHLGDVALFVSGFFGAHIERSLVNVDYYVQMGCSAYRTAASLARGGAFASVLAQLAEAYGRVVEVLTHVAEQTTLPVDRDVAALYERWLRNGDSSVLCNRLIDLGSVPVVCPARGEA